MEFQYEKKKIFTWNVSRANFLYFFGPKGLMFFEFNQFKFIFSNMVKYDPLGHKRHKLSDFE